MPGRRRRRAQPDLFDHEAERTLLDRLIQDARLYHSSAEYRALLEFTSRLRHVAPFNAMLLHLQRPGLTYAATRKDWLAQFGRHPKQGARPLIIMWPFGPVALVYDVQDTEGRELPRDAFSFPASGDISDQHVILFEEALKKNAIEPYHVDAGDAHAGSIQVMSRPAKPGNATGYRLTINRNHPPATRFVTLTHELAHLYLGHLGRDERLLIPERRGHSDAQIEVEAESTAYIVCKRSGIEARSETYLRHFAEAADKLDIYVIMRAAGQIEKLLGLPGKVLGIPMDQLSLALKACSEPVFDHDTYAKAIPIFKAGVAHFREGRKDLASMVRSLVQHFADTGMDREAVERMRPYLKRFVDDVRSGRIDIDRD